MKVNKKVRIISLDKRYRKHPYHFTVPRSDKSGKYVTGQESIIDEEQMIGKKAITKAQLADLQMGDQPMIINPENTYMLLHGRTFDLSYEKDESGKTQYLNPRDYAEFTFFSTKQEVSPSKETYNTTKHLFYIEDKIREAEAAIEKEDLAFDAESFVRNDISIGRYSDILLFLSTNINGYNVNPDNLSEVEIRAKVIDACRKYPGQVLKFKGSDTEEVIFVLKLMKYHILEKRNGSDIYYNEEFIGSSVESVRTWMRKSENSHLITKWGKQILDKEGKASVIEPSTPKRGAKKTVKEEGDE